MNYILARLKEVSTWKGAIALLTVAGVALSPDQAQAIATAGAAVFGALALLLPDKFTV